jgi:hypothetical protein
MVQCMSLKMVRAIERFAAARPFTKMLLASVTNHLLLSVLYKVWSLEDLTASIVFEAVLKQQQADPYPGRICRLAAWTCPEQAVYIVDRLLSGWDEGSMRGKREKERGWDVKSGRVLIFWMTLS